MSIPWPSGSYPLRIIYIARSEVRINGDGERRGAWCLCLKETPAYHIECQRLVTMEDIIRRCMKYSLLETDARTRGSASSSSEYAHYFQPSAVDSLH